MAGDSFDVIFSGQLAPGADPGAVRARIQGLFRLTDQAADRLFSGRAIAVKRALDQERAVRLRDTFREAGALVRLVEVGAGSAELSLAPADGQPLEPEPNQSRRPFDTDHLSLTPGSEWTLEDCDTRPPPAPVPDVSHLRLLEPEALEESG